MEKSTSAFKTGMTVIRGGNVPAYTLEYITPGKKKMVGEFETILVPYIEIGRLNTCNVQYGDDYTTVSRKHAAIERRGNDFFLIHLSATNPTILNGKVIEKEASLKNGDEIQLSMEGPKLRFNMTPSGSANMGFTKKIGLITSQAIKPYRKLVFSLLGLIILLAGAGSWFIYHQNKKVDVLAKNAMESEEKRIQDSIQSAIQIEQFKKQAAATSKELGAVMNNNDQYKEIINKLNEKVGQLDSIELKIQPGGPAFYKDFSDAVYFIKVIEVMVVMPNRSSSRVNISWTGAGFLCSDGKFITARHCIQAWRYSNDDNFLKLNFAELNGGKLFVKYQAIAENDDFIFEYKDVVRDDSKDITIATEDPKGFGRKKIYYKYASDFANDWAYYQTDNTTNNIVYDRVLSTKLTAGEKVYILGFSLGKGGPDEGKIKPIYSEASVGQSGISSSGLITLTARSFEKGTSGGPVFVQTGKSFTCIGIVSLAEPDAAGKMSTIAGIVPIANIK